MTFQGRFRVHQLTREMDRMKDNQLQIVEAIEANARHLLADAKILFEHGRYSTSMSLSILAAEEAVKSWIVCWRFAFNEPYNQEAPLFIKGIISCIEKKELLKHVDKQKSLYEVLYGLTTRKIIADILEKATLDAENQDVTSFLLTLLEALESSDVETWSIAHLLEELLIMCVLDEMNKRYFDITSDIYHNQFNKDKNSGLYVDLDLNGQGKLLNNPEDISPDKAKYYIDLAAILIDNLR